MLAAPTGKSGSSERYWYRKAGRVEFTVSLRRPW